MLYRPLSHSVHEVGNGGYVKFVKRPIETHGAVGRVDGSDDGCGLVGSGEGSGETLVGSTVGVGVGHHVPIELPVVTPQPVVTPLERAWTCVGTSSQS